MHYPRTELAGQIADALQGKNPFGDDAVYEFLFIAAPLKMQGATSSPVRPLTIPIRHPQ